VTSSQTINYLGAPVVLAEGLSFSPGGVLYISFHVDGERGFQSGHVGVIDPATATIDATTAVQLSQGSENDGDMLEFVGDTLYLGDVTITIGTFLYTVDLATGALTAVGEIGDAIEFFQLSDLAWDGRRLFGETFTGHGAPGTGRLIEIDPATARATVIGPAPDRELVGGITVAPRHPHDDDDDDDCDDDHDHREHHHRHHRHHESR
jgi:hypothetical protein